MSKSLIQVANESTQNVNANSVITPGSVIRRYGCNCQLSGNGIVVDGDGYYTIDASITAVPSTASNVTVSVYNDNVIVPGTKTSSYASEANKPVSLPVVGTIRKGCCCDNTSTLTFVLEEGAGTVTNFSARIEKA